MCKLEQKKKKLDKMSHKHVARARNIPKTLAKKWGNTSAQCYIRWSQLCASKYMFIMMAWLRIRWDLWRSAHREAQSEVLSFSLQWSMNYVQAVSILLLSAKEYWLTYVSYEWSLYCSTLRRKTNYTVSFGNRVKSSLIDFVQFFGLFGFSFQFSLFYSIGSPYPHSSSISDYKAS